MSGVEMTIKKLNPDNERERVKKLYQYEDEIYKQGYELIAGVDEAGRGSLAGPLTVGAVILPKDFYLERLDDSKKLSPAVREKLYDEIVYNAIAVSSIAVSVEEIDKFNVYQATLRGMDKAIATLNIQPDYVLIDAMKIYLQNIPVRSIVHGDSLSASIAAASIVAKVTRDRMAEEWSKLYPEYGFDKNKGYGTREHMDAIKKNGFTPIHRKTYEPYRSTLKKNIQIELF